jgi:hypothetical protein
MIVEVIGLFFQNTMHFVNDACSVWQRQVFEMEGCWKWNVRRCDPDEIRVGAGATAKVGEVVAVIDGDMTAKASVLNAAPAAKTSQWRPPFEEVSTPRFVVNRAPELERPARDRHGHLIEMPTRGWPRASTPKFSGEQRRELQYPSSHHFVGDIQTALRSRSSTLR